MVSGVQADPTRNVVEGPAASTDKIAETTNGVIKDTADRSSELDVHSCGKREGTLVQVVSCGWKAQPRFCTNADLWLVLIQ
jgi:hypothetical protein